MVTFPEPGHVPLRGGPVLRWGVLGPGAIAADWADAVLAHTDQAIAAVGSRSRERADAFAAPRGIAVTHAGYEALVADPAVDAIYVATPHGQHREHALLAIDAGKHVLIEKPLAATAADARAIADAARAAGVFAAEAMWTSFTPRSRLLRHLLADGALGTPRTVRADFGSTAARLPTEHRIHDRATGGALLDIGVYPVAFALAALGAPTAVHALGRVLSSGVDGTVALALAHTGGASFLGCSIEAASASSAEVAGTEGTALFPSRFWAPGDLVLHTAAGEATWRDPDGLVGREGLAYPVVAAAADIAAGRTDSAVHPLTAAIAALEVLDAARRQLGTLRE